MSPNPNTTITHEDLDFLSRCERLYELNRKARSTAPIPLEQRITMASGRAHHKASATTDLVLREQIIEHALIRVPVARREEVRTEIVDMVKHSDQAAITEDAGLQREVQLFWTDPKTGWTLAAKPDLFGKSDRIEIKEEKRSKRFFDSHKFQVWFASFVAARIDADEQALLPYNERRYLPVIATVRCSRFTDVAGVAKRMWQRTFRFPIESLERETWAIREKIKLIIRRERSNYFVAKLEFDTCSSCPRRSECTALLRNGPLLARLKEDELRRGRPTAFVEIAPEPTSASSTPVIADETPRKTEFSRELPASLLAIQTEPTRAMA